MESILFHECIGNICNCKEVYFHEECAVKWFTPRVQGISKGRVIDNNWKTIWSASCEVCNREIDKFLIDKCILQLKKESFKMLKKSINPMILPNVPEETTNEVVVRQRTLINTHPISVTSPRSIESNNNNSLSIFRCFKPTNNRT
jgi:hypothetical protein